MKGMPSVPKYDSHVVMVDRKNNSQHPVPPSKWNDFGAWMEYVIFDTAHVFPLFLMNF